MEDYARRNAKKMGGVYEYSAKFLKGIPIKIPNQAQHDKMVSLVDRMLALHKEGPNTPQEKESLKREIGATDSQIDRLVYELYGLTEDEIKIAQGT